MNLRFLAFVLLLCMMQAARAESDPWTAEETIQPAELARLVTQQFVVCAGNVIDCTPPEILMVGPRILYNGAHVKGAIYAGPAGKSEGLESLTRAAVAGAKNRRIVLYCGCCPMEKCPNIRPAFQKLKEMGYSSVKVLIIPTNLHDDWTAKGYPVDRGETAH